METPRKRRFRIISRRGVIRIAIALTFLSTLALGCYLTMIRMPGRSHTGPLPPLSSETRDVSARLRAHVAALAGDIGERNLGTPAQLRAASDYIAGSFTAKYEAVLQVKADITGKIFTSDDRFHAGECFSLADIDG